MGDLTWILDPATGALVAEGVTAAELSGLADDLLPMPRQLNCARPLHNPPLPTTTTTAGVHLRIARIYHGSVVEGPGRRSVVQVQGCPIRCRGCYVPETHPRDGGVRLDVETVVSTLLNPVGAPRDGVTVLGGEPFAQPAGLAALLRRLKARGVHTVVYSGYTLETLARRAEPEVRRALCLTDLLIDGPFIAALAADAGAWRGSRNQRLIPHPGRMLAAGWDRAATTPP